MRVDKDKNGCRQSDCVGVASKEPLHTHTRYNIPKTSPLMPSDHTPSDERVGPNYPWYKYDITSLLRCIATLPMILLEVLTMKDKARAGKGDSGCFESTERTGEIEACESRCEEGSCHPWIDYPLGFPSSNSGKQCPSLPICC